MTESASTPFLIETPEQLRVLADPLRQKLLAAFAEPATVKQAAEALGSPLSRLYHHVDQLQAAGLIKVVGEQRRRGAVERTFEAVARRFAVSETAFGVDGPAAGHPGAAYARSALEGLLAEAPADKDPETMMHVARTQARLTPEGLAQVEKALGESLKRFESPEGLPTEILLVASPRKKKP